MPPIKENAYITKRKFTSPNSSSRRSLSQPQRQGVVAVTPTAAIVDLTKSNTPVLPSTNHVEIASPNAAVVDLTQAESPVDCHENHGDEVIFVHDVDDDEVEEIHEHHVLIASCQCDVVGIRYYAGTAHEGEFVSLCREPQNPYDRNAIRVDNVRGEKVGHLKREQASLLAPLIDQQQQRLQRQQLGGGRIMVEGTIPFAGNSYTLPCQLDFFAVAPREHLQETAQALSLQLMQAFRKSRLSLQPKWATPPPPPDDDDDVQIVAAPVAPAVTYKELDWQTQAKELDAMFDKQSSEQLKNLPEISMPSTLTTELFDYQIKGVRWLVHQETSTKPPPFYRQLKEKYRKVWFCDITNSSQPEPPKPLRGGILADEMGLGKTLQVISLMLAAPPDTTTTSASTKKTNCTLIVCPVSVMSNWEQQIKAHVGSQALPTGIYQGSSRTYLLDKVKSGKIKVLLVSYHTLAAECTKIFGKGKGSAKATGLPSEPKKIKRESIFDCSFHRIVLDEAHMIRSSKTSLFQAVCRVQADRKWALTGTPFVNRADDIHSLLAFLQVDPLCDKDIYRRAITMPIQNGEDIGLTRLRALMAHVALRRSKTTANIQLVEKTVHLSTVEFVEGCPHKAVYEALFGSFRLAVQSVLKQRQGEAAMLQNYTHIFETLLRLRQACCSAQLVPPARKERAMELWKELKQRQDTGSPQLTVEEGMELLEKLKGTFSEGVELPECAVCLMEMEEAQTVILRTCSHIYCSSCIHRVSSTSQPSCPLCRKSFTKADMVKQSAVTVAATQQTSTKQVLSAKDRKVDFRSPKIMALLDTIGGAVQADEKGVIFSQFTSFLDLIQPALSAAGHSYTRLDGSMSAAKRMEAIQAFSSDKEGSPRFILCSLHAAGTGINLTRANHAFLMDCWWNQAVENQAMDRIHRIGQQREVRVVRFVMKDSIEERIVTLQEAKSMQAKGAMQKLKADEQRKSRLNDLKGLLLLDQGK